VNDGGRLGVFRDLGLEGREIRELLFVAKEV
jgi:hypothetical protein